MFLPELTFDNYRKIFDLYYVRLFARTLRLGLITTAAMRRARLPARLFFGPGTPAGCRLLGLFLLIMPLMVSAVIRVFGWIVILGRKGLVNQDAGRARVGARQTAVQRNRCCCRSGLVNIFVPFMVLPIMASCD